MGKLIMLQLLKNALKKTIKPLALKIARNMIIEAIRNAEQKGWLRGIDLPEEKIADVIISFAEPGAPDPTPKQLIAVRNAVNTLQKNI
jgi:hypothetical protein